jgi:hypothetical protein
MIELARTRQHPMNQPNKLSMKNDSIPSDTHEIYGPLFHDVCHLHRKWGIFCQLYGSGESIIALLNTAAPGFFRICEDLLADDVLLSISRLRDPKQTLRKDNLTLERLVHSIDVTKYPRLRLDVERLLSDIRVKSAFVKAQRDRRIAHADLSTKLQVSLLSPPMRTDVEHVLQAIRSLMNAIELYFNMPLYVRDVNVVCVDYTSPALYADAHRLIARLRNDELLGNQADGGSV